jgi:hypothetical protein
MGNIMESVETVNVIVTAQHRTAACILPLLFARLVMADSTATAKMPE